MMRTNDIRPAFDGRRPGVVLGWAAIGFALFGLALSATEARVRPAKQIEIHAPVDVTPGAGRATVITEMETPAEIFAQPATALALSADTLAARARPSSSRLLGMAPEALRTALGAPDFLRRDGSTQMWRYGSGNCTLTLSFSGQAGVLRVEHVEARAPAGIHADESGEHASRCRERLIGETRRTDLPG